MTSKAIAKTDARNLPGADAQIAAQLTDQYRKAVSGTRDVLIFGAMMRPLGVVLELQNNSHGPQTKGDGLKGWIEKNCPLINYNTAYGMYGFARSAREALSIPPSTSVHKLLTAPVDELSKREQKIRKELEGAIEGNSVNACMTGWGFRKAREPRPESGGAREGAGRKPASLTREQLQLEAFFSDEAVLALSKAVHEKRWHLRLDDQKKDVLLAIAQQLVRDLGGK